MTERVFQVRGMNCADCSKTVQNVIESLSGVHTAVTHLKQKTVDVAYDETQVEIEDIIRAVREAGYDISE